MNRKLTSIFTVVGLAAALTSCGVRPPDNRRQPLFRRPWLRDARASASRTAPHRRSGRMVGHPGQQIRTVAPLPSSPPIWPDGPRPVIVQPRRPNELEVVADRGDESNAKDHWPFQSSSRARKRSNSPFNRANTCLSATCPRTTNWGWLHKSSSSDPTLRPDYRGIVVLSGVPELDGRICGKEAPMGRFSLARTGLLVLGAVLTVTSCGDGDVNLSKGITLNLVLATSDLAVGKQRLSYVVLDDDVPITEKTTFVRFFKNVSSPQMVAQGAIPWTPIGAEEEKHSGGGHTATELTGIYSVNAEFDEPEPGASASPSAISPTKHQRCGSHSR